MPHRNRVLRNNLRSSIGSGQCRSRITKATPRATPATMAPTITGEVQPYEFPNETAESTATTAGKNNASPFQSKGTRSFRWRLRGMRSKPAITPSTPKGTLTMKMRRQPPAANSSPPTDGPNVSPTAWAAPWTPIALPSDGRGTAITMMATLFACSMAAPTAWRTLNAISAPRVGARPQSAEPITNTANP